ncbi:hypothetical protein [Bacillus manliponensis]|uniref:hypothetical protein n=1 Tax=Bacillus manliponensis TaxID=574376 RepID=UPI00351205D9
MKDLVLVKNITRDLNKGLKWGEIAKNYDVPMSYVQSIYSKNKMYQNPAKHIGGNGRLWRGWRNHDGVEAPINTYHISELEKSK